MATTGKLRSSRLSSATWPARSITRRFVRKLKHEARTGSAASDGSTAAGARSRSDAETHLSRRVRPACSHPASADGEIEDTGPVARQEIGQPLWLDIEAAPLDEIAALLEPLALPPFGPGGVSRTERSTARGTDRRGGLPHPRAPALDDSVHKVRIVGRAGDWAAETLWRNDGVSAYTVSTRARERSCGAARDDRQRTHRWLSLAAGPFRRARGPSAREGRGHARALAGSLIP